MIKDDDEEDDTNYYNDGVQLPYQASALLLLSTIDWCVKLYCYCFGHFFLFIIP